jgi:hypothetical protein
MKATAPDFFYTRLKARMLAQVDKGREAAKPALLRPAYAFAALIIVLLINVAVLFQNSNNNSDMTAATTIDTDSIQALASEYSVTDAGILYDLNLEK